jgi:hypothetical protein
VTLAEATSPRPHQRSRAYHALARALGLAIAAPTALRRLDIATLARALGGGPDTTDRLHRLSVQNDGTVDALVVAWPPGLRLVNAETSVEAVRALRAAESPAPTPGEDGRLVRAFVELVALDYLAGDGARGNVFVDDTSGVIVAADATAAFPPWVDPKVDAHALGRLRAFQRFPRGLRDALARLDREAARAALQPGPFERWLVTPRALVELDERRLALLTLLDARVAALGQAAVLSL